MVIQVAARENTRGVGVTRKLRMIQGVLVSLEGQGHLLRAPWNSQSRKGLKYSLTQGMKLAPSFSFGNPPTNSRWLLYGQGTWNGTVNSHKNRLDGVFDVAKGCPAQQLPQAPLSQLCWVLLFLLRCLEGRWRPAVETESCG